MKRTISLILIICIFTLSVFSQTQPSFRSKLTPSGSMQFNRNSGFWQASLSSQFTKHLEAMISGGLITEQYDSSRGYRSNETYVFSGEMNYFFSENNLTGFLGIGFITIPSLIFHEYTYDETAKETEYTYTSNQVNTPFLKIGIRGIILKFLDIRLSYVNYLDFLGLSYPFKIFDVSNYPSQDTSIFGGGIEFSLGIRL